MQTGSSILLSLLLLSCLASEAEERVPWTSSQVSGSPDPPKPYAAEVIWPQVTFQKGCDIAHLPSRQRIFITEQKGKIWMLPDDLSVPAPEKELFADFSASHDPFESSFSLCFHPDFEKNREVFVFYRINARGEEDGTRIARFRTYSDRLELDPASEQILLTFRSGGHNGGHLGFGPDGMLYILTGDAEVPSPPDPLNTGQDNSDLLSCVLRIDVDSPTKGKPYVIPPDNPFVSEAGCRPEIWAYGFRNPWKLCFHPKTGDLWVGDVGWELWEMLYRVERGSNFGWSIVEAVQPIKVNQDPGPSPISPATVMHPHTEFASITGGYVYEGDRLPGLKGVYLYGDYVTGQLWGLWLDGSEIVKKEFLADTRLQIVTFGQAAGGEVLFLDWPDNTRLHRLVPNPVEDRSDSFPRKLSETGIFSDLSSEEPAPGVYPFSISGTMWKDGATADRWIGIPGEATIETPVRGPFSTIPENTVLVKTLTLGGKKRETQLLHFTNKQWQGYSYRWNKQQTDATLVDAAGETVELDGHPWTFPSRADCVRCHNIGSDYRLAFQPGQLNRDEQLNRLLGLGLVNEEFVKRAEKQPSACVEDESAPLDLRARTWLSANCAHCHRRRGGGSVTIKMDLATKLEESDLMDFVPEKGIFGIADARLLKPGDPLHSILYYRAATSGIGHMPMIGSRTVDPEGAKLLHDWIASLGDSPRIDPGIDTVPSALALQHAIRSGKISGKKAADWIARGKKAEDPIISGLFQDW